MPYFQSSFGDDLMNQSVVFRLQIKKLDEALNFESFIQEINLSLNVLGKFSKMKIPNFLKFIQYSRSLGNSPVDMYADGIIADVGWCVK